MNWKSKTLWNSSIILVLLCVSCATVRYQRDISEYQSEINKLETKLKTNPEDSEALQDLGVIYFETEQYSLAIDYLQKAYEYNPNDPKTMFYLGMTLEFQNKNQEALKIHEKFIEVSRLSPYRRLMEGRYRRLNREIIRQEIRTLLQQEQQLSEDRMTSKTIAIFPLIYQGKDEQYAPLGKGLSEMIIIDLGQVQELQLLERIRMQTLLEELKLAQTELINKQSAPRFGKLLGAGRILAGTFNILKKKQLQVDVLSWDIINHNFPDATSQSDALENLFRLEKDLVFNVIEEMGIELTPQERDNIQHIPTKNIQAFLAFCKGLEKEDAMQFNAAVKFYQEAIKLDPDFKAAANKSEAAESLSQAGGSSEDVLGQIVKIEGQEIVPVTSPNDLINNRLQNLGSNVGSNFVPGQDSRKSTEEASSSGADLGELPKPPEPPE
ncbi:MAG: tetratricopeptide repeat protein [bacterium]